MKFLRATAIIFITIFIIQMNTIVGLANSAQSDWEGVDSTGTIVTGEDCPIVVEKELLTFDIDEFPQSYYGSETEFLSYTGTVQAQYTFYNPADYTVNAKLVFPFGAYPSYGWHNDNRSVGRRAFDEDTEKYHITVDGNTIEKKLRYTFFDRNDQFELKEDLALLQDGYVEDSFYTPDMLVTKYTYIVNGLDEEHNPAASVAFDIPSFDGKRRVLFKQESGFQRNEDGSGRISTSVKNGTHLTLYVIGEPYPNIPEGKFYEDGGVEDGKEIDGVATLSSTSELSFHELVLMAYSTESDILETDWYNAMVAAFNQCAINYASVIFFDEFFSFDISSSLMRWYEYEITLEPRQSLVNTVEAPIYPSIDGKYEPPIFKYTYLLSPAQTWAEFGELEILINTPFYVTESSLNDFTKTDAGYYLKLEGLPKGELTFTMSSSESIKSVENSYTSVLKAVLVIALGILVVVVMIVSRTVKPINK